MNKPHIALMGAAGAGKDTLARFLVAEHGYQRLAFADQLKAFLYDIDPVVRESVDELGSWERAKQLDPYVRPRLVEVGNAARQHIDPYVWMHPLLDVWPDEYDYTPVVVTDVRTQSEIQMLIHENAVFVLVLRDGCDETTPTPPDGTYVFHNNGTVAQLHARVDEVLAKGRGNDRA